jgi:hypothetical protein
MNKDWEVADIDDFRTAVPGLGLNSDILTEGKEKRRMRE